MENYLKFENNTQFDKLKTPAKIIKSGGIVVFPTETVYGIGTNGLDEKAIRKLYEVKQRPLEKPISLLVSNIKMIESVAKNITDVEYKIIEHFFPGPLTIILNKKEIVPDILTAGTSTVGIRMPDYELTRKLISYAGVPVATPSANISSHPSGTDINVIMKEFNDKVDFYIDSGKSKIGLASTIVKVENGIPKILRQGSITLEQIKSIL